MIAVIGDRSAVNRRFLRLAVANCGYPEVLETATAEDLADCVAKREPDLVVYDPALADDDAEGLLTWLQRHSDAAIIVVSPHENMLAHARQLGVRVVRKRSVLDLGEIESAIAAARAERRRRRTSVIDIRKTADETLTKRLDDTPDEAPPAYPAAVPDEHSAPPRRPQ